jgi:cytidyltransferase-like protein
MPWWRNWYTRWSQKPMDASSCGFESHPRHHKMAYILPKKVLRDVSQSLQDRGEKIVFTHGAFDLFHVGHFDLLHKSKKKGNVLIVGVESDERISTYKNVHRPVISFKDRLQLLSAISLVDFILPIEGQFKGSSEYFGLYKLISPNVVTFGPNWAGTTHIKADKELLPNLVFAQVVRQHNVSTTKIIKRVLTRNEALLK